MSAVRSIWHFIAGDSRVAPIGVAVALLLVYAAQRAGAPQTALQALMVLAVIVTLALAVREGD